MKVYGLTGGVGMGKSSAAGLLSARGVRVIDTDHLARQLVEPGQAALGEIHAAFGNQIIAPDGGLRRDELARTVFADSAARRKLEAILHPRIRELWKQQVEAWRSEHVPVAVVVIPLLFETGAETEFDGIICVACSPATQHERLMARGWPVDQIAGRLAAQWPVERKITRSDYLIWTEGPLESTARQLERVVF